MTQAVLDKIEQEIPHLRRYARALTRDPDRADDLVQDALERAVSRIEKFEAGTDLRSWMFTIMHNVHIDHCRRNKRRGIHVPIETWTRETHQAASQPWALEVRDFVENFGRLRRSEKDVLLLVGLRGLKYEEAAEELGVAVGTVKSRLFRARETLRRMQDGLGH